MRRVLRRRSRDIAVGAGLCFAVGILFYRSIIAALALTAFTPFYVKRARKRAEREHEWELTDHFCEAARSLAAAMEAGYSVENALKVAASDLKVLYAEDDTMVRELEYMYRQTQNSVSAETAFAEFADRMRIEDIQSFSDVFVTAKRTGGDIIGIVDRTVSVILMKHEVRREIRTITAAKRFETMIMKLVPFGILAYLNLFSAAMVEGLYASFAGHAFMTAMLVVYLFASHLADRIVDIKL